MACKRKEPGSAEAFNTRQSVSSGEQNMEAMPDNGSSDDEQHHTQRMRHGEEEEERKTVREEEESEDESRESSDAAEDDDSSGEEEDHQPSSNSDGDNEDDGGGGGRTNSTAFGRAFNKIMKKKLPASDLVGTMGPMLTEHKKLIFKKLEEAASEQKARGEAKKERQALRERGHIVLNLCADPKEKLLFKLATKGVVKLFNAVSKAQHVQSTANAKRLKASDAKATTKQMKATFLAELRGSGGGSVSANLSKNDGSGWSVLQDNFMLGKSRLKDWDKREETEADVHGIESSEDGSISE